MRRHCATRTKQPPEVSGHGRGVGGRGRSAGGRGRSVGGRGRYMFHGDRVVMR